MIDLVRGKKVVVTGGTGSIGSELVRQLLAMEPEAVRILSRDETLQSELYEGLGRPDRLRLLIGDVREYMRVRRAVRDADVVFHAAALKHVPSCEYNPFEAVRTNVLGTENVIQACTDEGVERLIAISTDKAVSPEHTMGSTKLLAEKLLTNVNRWTKRPLTACVRFGNVLGSRGSIIPLVREMIARGEPVRLTSPHATRFMMTIPQAVALVLKAFEKVEGGETFILKMPVLNVRDLIEGIIRKQCKALGADPAKVKIEEIGLRPGEKLHERLATDDEIARLHDAGDYFALYAPWRMPETLGPKATPEMLRSDRKTPPLLSAAEIDQLLSSI